MDKQPVLNDQLLDIQSVLNITQSSKAKLYRDIKFGRFPKPVKLVRRSLWPLSDINAWMDSLKQSR